MRKFVMSAVIGLVVFSIPAFSDDLSRYRDQEVANLVYFSPSVPMKVAAIRELGRRQYTPAAPYLIELCYDRNREIRTASIQALGVMKVDEAFDSFFFIVWERSNSFTTWDKMAATTALGHNPHVHVNAIMDILNLHPDLKVSFAAASSLQNRPEFEALMIADFWAPILDQIR